MRPAEPNISWICKKKTLPENWQCAVDLQDLVLETVSLQVPILFNSYNSILTQIFVLIRNLDINSPIHTDDSPPLFFFLLLGYWEPSEPF